MNMQYFAVFFTFFFSRMYDLGDSIEVGLTDGGRVDMLTRQSVVIAALGPAVRLQNWRATG